MLYIACQILYKTKRRNKRWGIRPRPSQEDTNPKLDRPQEHYAKEKQEGMERRGTGGELCIWGGNKIVYGNSNCPQLILSGMK